MSARGVEEQGPENWCRCHQSVLPPQFPAPVRSTPGPGGSQWRPPSLVAPQGNEGTPRWSSHLHPQLPGMSCLHMNGKKMKDANAADIYSADFTQMPEKEPPSLPTWAEGCFGPC